MSFTKATAIIFDIELSVISSPLESSIWADYECGFISQQVCYDRISNGFHISPSELAKAFDQARDSLQSNDEMLSFIRKLKQSDGHLQDNVSRLVAIRQSLHFCRSWRSKTQPRFYRQVLDDIAVDAASVVFVDDKLDNVLSARSFGMRGIIFDDQKRVIQAIRNAVEDPVARARSYLQRNAKLLHSVTSTGATLMENFTQLLILEATRDLNLVSLVDHEREWNFFQGKPILTTETYPCDLDTTSVALTVTPHSKEIISSVMDEILKYIDKDGIVQTYFDHQRPRFDPVVCANVLTLFYANGRGHELPHTFAWVQEVLVNRGYIDGTRYYATPECFLFFMARLLEQIKDTKAGISLRPILRQRVQERIGSEGDALALVMRVLACVSVGIRDEVDLRTLLTHQQEDGGWEAGWVYRLGTSKIKVGNRGLTVALAINAIEALNQTPSYTPQPPVVKSYRISNVSSDSPVVEDHLQSRAEGIHFYGWRSSSGEWTHSLWKHFQWPWVNFGKKILYP